MSGGSKRGLVAPQNTFLENVIRKISQNETQCCFLLANSQLCDWPIVYVSDAFCDLTGIPRSQFISQSSICEFMHGNETDAEGIEKLKTELTDNKGRRVELLLYTSKSGPLWFLIHVATIYDDKDESVFLLLTFRNITHIKYPNGQKLQKGILRKGGINILLKSSSFTNQEKNRNNDESAENKNCLNDAFNFETTALPRYRQEPPQTPRYIVLHYNSLKLGWDSLILILTFYTAIVVPYNAVFPVKKRYITDGWFISDSIVDLIFLGDIALNFLTTIVGPGGEVISDPKLIQMNYIKSWFVIDLLSCLPYDLFTYIFTQPEPGITGEGISNLFSALKVVRLLRLGKIARRFEQYIEYGGAMLILLVCFFGLSGHWLACIWYSISSKNLLENDKLVSTNWLVILGEQINQPFYLNGTEVFGGPSALESYIAALYFTMTSLTSVGFGNISANTIPEQVFCVIMLIFGALLFATIFGNVTSIIQRMYEETNRYHEMLNNVRNFVNLHRIPVELRDRILDYVVSSWSMSKGIDTKQVLESYPKDMRADISIHLHREVFSKHEAFALASDSCRRALAVEFMASHSSPTDMIYHKGEEIDCLNFVISGSLEVSHNDEVIAILSKGDVFGDGCWDSDSNSQSACNVKALTYCDLNLIKHEALKNVLSFYKSFAESFTKKLILTVDLRKRIFFRKVEDLKRDEAIEGNDPTLHRIFPENHAVRQFPKITRKKVEERKRLKEEMSLRGRKPSVMGLKTSESIKDLSNCEDNVIVLDSEKTSDVVKSVCIQKQKIDEIEQSICHIVDAIEKLSQAVNINPNINRNNNTNSNDLRSFSNRSSFDNTPNTFSESKTSKVADSKHKHVQTQTCSFQQPKVMYINECKQRVQSSKQSNRETPTVSKSSGNNEQDMVLIDLEVLETDDFS